MPPRRAQRSAQYWEPALPPITFSTARLPVQSGHCERTGREVDGNWPVSMYDMAGAPVLSGRSGSVAHRLDGGPAMLEMIDVMLGVLDGSVLIVPGKADLER